MPLASGRSPATVSNNIRELHTGKTYAHTTAKFGKQRANRQAIAIALNEARKSRAGGGGTFGGGPMAVPATPAPSPSVPQTPFGPPAAAITPAPQTHGELAAPGTVSTSPAPTPPPGGIAAPFGPPASAATIPAPLTHSVAATGVSRPASTFVSAPMLPQSPIPAIATPTPNLTQPQPAPTPPSGFGGPVGTPAYQPWWQQMGLKTGGRADGGAGSFNMANAPHVGMTGPAAYPARAMMRNMTRGALLTSTPGRADAHRTFVPSGSYVIPADVVSGRGQGNTLNGAGVLSHMFGMGPMGEKGGPYGSGLPKMGGGKGMKSMMPKPPKLQTSILSASGGGKEGDQMLGAPVPVNLSGGEVVVPPEHLLETFRRVFPGKNYTLKQIHAMMDQWVLDERKRHRKTLAKLPGPAKD